MSPAVKAGCCSDMSPGLLLCTHVPAQIHTALCALMHTLASSKLPCMVICMRLPSCRTRQRTETDLQDGPACSCLMHDQPAHTE